MFVSAVVPVYNASNTLERAIKSLLIQQEINEIFIVDDGSSDGSFALALQLEMEHEIIKVLIHEGRINQGASASRNLGLKYCRNEWVQFLDADDELLPEKIRTQIDLTSPNINLIVGNSLFASKGGIKKVTFYKDPFVGLLMAKFGNTCANLWRKLTVEAVGGWNENLINTQEYDLMFRILKTSSNVSFSTPFLTRVNKTSGSITVSSLNQFQKRDNLLLYRIDIRDYLVNLGCYSLKYKLYFSASIGTVLRYHSSNLKIDYSKFLYFLYRIRKSIKDRIY